MENDHLEQNNIRMTICLRYKITGNNILIIEQVFSKVTTLFENIRLELHFIILIFLKHNSNP